MRVLYVHHCGIFGGSSRSLCEVIREITAKGVDACVLTPSGNAAEQFAAAGAQVTTCGGITQWDNTLYSYYRGLRWLVLLRELLYLPTTVFGLLKAKKRWPDVDFVHVNEITAVVPALIARALFRCPVLIHARSVYRTTAESRRSRFILRLLLSVVDRIVAIDQTVARSLPPSERIVVIHNSFSSRETQGSDRVVEFVAKRASATSRLKVAMVGNLIGVKGVREFVEAAKLCRDRGLKIDFFLVGGNIRRKTNRLRFVEWIGLNQDVRDWMERFISDNALHDVVHLTGPTMNIGEVYKRIDVLCFPSYFDAPGRPVFEAAFFAVPSIVAVTRPTADTFVHEQTGLAIPARNAEALADAIQRLHDHPSERKHMGYLAQRLAEENFHVRKNAQKLISLYKSLLPGKPGLSQTTTDDSPQTKSRRT